MMAPRDDHRVDAPARALHAAILALALISGCSRETPPIAADTIEPGSVVGDTFVLVAIGAKSTASPVSDSAPCGRRPYLRLVISNESQFYHVTDNRPTCFGPPTDSAARYTSLWSTYEVSADTLHLFSGDGPETFYWLSGKLTRDSLIELSSDEPRRFVRIRPHAVLKKP